MKIKLTGNRQIDEAINVFQIIFPKVIEATRRRTIPFDMANCSNLFIADEIEKFDKEIKIVPYNSRWPWQKKVYGYYSGGTTFYINMTSIKWRGANCASIVGTLQHEIVHTVDAFSNCSFGHGDNSPIGKQSTCPYALGSLAQEMAQDYLKGKA